MKRLTPLIALEPKPTTAADFYPARYAELLFLLELTSKKAHWWARGMGLLGLGTLVTVVLSVRGRAPAWTIALSLVVLGATVFFYLGSQRELHRLGRLVNLYTKALARLDGSVPQTGQTGEEFRSATHLYEGDLAILGPDSLFGLLATVRTGIGQRRLAHDLLHPHERDATLARQEAIRELAPCNDLREQVHLLGVSQFQQVPASFFDAWLAEPPPTFHPAFRWLLTATTTVGLVLLLLGATQRLPWGTINPKLLAVFSVQAALALLLRPRVLPMLNAATHLSNQVQMFRDGLALLQANSFTSLKLRDLQAQSHRPSGAVKLLARLQHQLAVAQQRTKGFSLILSLLTCAGTHAALSIAAWKRANAQAMTGWLAAWAEFESLSALATYAYEHPENTYPEMLSPGAATFEATALAHPLLGMEAVANDISLHARGSAETADEREASRKTNLYLISGSNMAGKSTLLRAIGLNAVLAAAGAPIRARSARISPLAIGASLALTDSLAEGKSKFLAEVERLHAILQLSEDAAPVLFLIDEIFSGTNSLDRRIAAEAVARVLIARGAIGALSTHDLTLTEMAADPALYAANVHMASPDAADPLGFDYRLKPGINPSSNALAILRMVGIALR